MKKILLFFLIMTASFLMVACDNEDPINTENTFNVVFIVDGNAIADLKIIEGEKISPSDLPNDPTKENYTFKFWTKEGEETPFDVNTKITDHLILVAYFESNGGGVVIPPDPEPGELLAYYKKAEGLTGNALKSALNQIITKTAISYDRVRDMLEESDVRLDNPTQLYLIYDSKSTHAVWDSAKTWNREHVWPDSKLGSAPKGEAHNLRASDVDTNGNRGNLAFAEGTGQYGKRSNGGYFPGDEHKGDVARIVMFMVTRYSHLNFGSSIGNLDMFLRWHLEDPVNDFEKNRNEVIFKFQGNRNPFIDHPELAQMIWGSTPAKKVVTQDLPTFLIPQEMLYIERKYLI